jgi:hypothetical protein
MSFVPLFVYDSRYINYAAYIGNIQYERANGRYKYRAEKDK